MKKALIVLALFLLVPVLFVTAADKKKLTLWYPAGDITATSMPFREGTDPWAQFEADNNVQVDVVAIDYDTMQQKLFTALAGGKAPDIGMIDFSWMGGFIKDGALVAIPAADAKTWMSSVSPDTVAVSDWGGGKMYGYSTWGVDAYALTWNKDMFKAAGLDPNVAPKYWADFRATSKKTAVTDSTGKVALPTTSIKTRVIGATDNTIAPDFSSNGKTTGVAWAKVWDTTIADGKVIGTTTVKTGKVMNDIADSAIYLWTGDYQFTYDGKLLKMSANLDAVKK